MIILKQEKIVIKDVKKSPEKTKEVLFSSQGVV